ncbi:MAG: RsmB/NOP family class I SAM-dependent RNA methyltransferase [Chlorobi bacterium]|nr:RsmB/NOP family class I SAM-dependent RNA methyltransferase [Chlorobiota bacterium]
MVTQHLLSQLAHGIAAVIGERRHADRVIERLLRPLPPHDERRSLVARTVYGVVRHLRRLVWALGESERFDERQIADCVRAWWIVEDVPLSKSLRTGLPPRRQLLDRWHAAPTRAVRYSVSDWLDRYGAEQCGSRWDTLLAAFEREPQIVLRTNTLCTTREQLLAALHSRGIAARPHPLSPEAIAIEGHVNVFALEEFHAGLFEMQDAASQAIVHLLGVEPGMRVVDACAGSGGKTLHIAALMQNRGRIVALDTAAWKLTELRRRAARAHVSIIETRAITSSKTIKRLAASADRLLLDLPCSGSGVWRRNPDGKWHLSADDLARLQQTQRDLVRRYTSMLAPGGIALVCTCSIFPDEGERLIECLVAERSEFTLLRSGRFEPDQHDTDGFFWALVERN